ncbi:DUF739 family protein [Anaerovorax odorimutans]|uniref:DUF739 family protein n=1 Tax=Anaerovorax odorimutans TaxID=109327 RepID=UPI0003FA2D54|nr:DUF739 family protein [Anaerovorax odorimutans]
MKMRLYPELKALKGKIREEGESYRSLSIKIPMGSNTLSDKINGFALFNSDEIYRVSELLNIQPEEIIRYFFPSMIRNATKIS